MPSPQPIVFLVDDDASVRRALTRLIKSAGHQQVQGFASAQAFLDAKPQWVGPACLVLDIRMPGVSGLDLQSELLASNSILPIIFITGHGDIPMSVKAMKAGAVDFLPKPVGEKTLLPAIEQALARASRQRAEAAELQDIRRRLDSLTPREREVMGLVVTGMLNKRVAYELGTVEKTIKVHRARVMEKMEVGSLAELVRLAERLGIGKT
ncbi:MAG: DNA-binding response regulator [Deltaproteobacteria bacterium]|nr:DNA-binding response regulator [Deltaproteobacteria bacterium]